ncbi:MAG: SMC-Scp complex subunit ScpB [bacterium]|nr:SMC-Scp complex subunit ScpB [bacterium]
MENTQKNLPAVLEAILFVSTGEESVKNLAALLNVKEKEVKEALVILAKECENRGVAIVENNGKVQMASNPKYAAILSKYQQKNSRAKLSDLALETLAIIAYRGPISRYKIEEIRGVNSVFILRNLLRRGLIERKYEGKKVEYAITLDFLRHLGLTKITALPKYDQFKKDPS